MRSMHKKIMNPGTKAGLHAAVRVVQAGKLAKQVARAFARNATGGDVRKLQKSWKTGRTNY